MPKAEWAMRMEVSRIERQRETEKARYRLAVKLHAKRMVARMNREVLDPEKVMFDPITRQWRLLSDEEKLANQMARAELNASKIDGHPATNTEA